MAHTFRHLRGVGFQPAKSRLAGWKPVLLAVVAMFAVNTVAAQSAAAPVQRFTVFSVRSLTDVAFVPRANAAPQKLVSYTTARSPRYEYRGAMPLRFVDATTGAVIAEAAIPPEIREPLLLFSPLPATSGGGSASATSPLRYQIAVLDDSAARHGPGGLAIINLSGLALSGTVGSENVTLKAGLNPAFAIGRSAKVVLWTAGKERNHRSYAENVQLGAGQRALLILFPPFYQGSRDVLARLLIDEPPK